MPKIKNLEKVIIKCQQCRKEFELLKSVFNAREKKGKIKFCSKKCEGLNKTKKIKKNCLFCDKEFLTLKGKYCSQLCSSQDLKKSGKNKKSGFWIENGYKVLYLEGNKSIKEHIKVMEEFLGRKLNKNECVHHINENKLDNNIENLQLLTRGEHSSLHRKKEIDEGKKLFKNKNN